MITQGNNKLPQVRKRIRAPVSDSSDDETKPQPKTSVPLKPQTNGAPAPNANSHGNAHQKVKKQRRGSHRSDSDIDDYKKSNRPVYESDGGDSDEDDSDGHNTQKTKNRNNHMTSGRQKVFDFINEAQANEFLSVKSFSQKKIDLLIVTRPFKDWPDLVNRIQTIKGLTPDMLNNCQEFLTRRNNLSKIMSKCTKLVDQLEGAVAKGGGIVKQPGNLNTALKLADYQMIGLNWLTVMHKEEMNGILADEMGLGKTIQVIAFLAWMKEAGRAQGTHLIVVPSSTLENWAQELQK